jgi:SAM-dependent methyltransferase
MTDESKKTRLLRGAAFTGLYLRGRVIDIGCGRDLVVPHAEPFDLEHGDAQEIAAVRENTAYDCVHSSHCLEHMRDVPRALAQWWSLVREGGYLVVVVPDEDLYEQGGWPSLFNQDHKATFRFRKASSWSPVSYDLVALIERLPGATVVSNELQDAGYDHGLRKRRLRPADRLLFKLNYYIKAVLRRLGPASRLVPLSERFFALLNAPVDQTEGAATAQIQVIARKEALFSEVQNSRAASGRH